jgi:glucokinase
MQKPYVLGLDMGGTNSVLGVVDARGHVLGRTSIKTQAYKDINDYVNALYEEAEKIIEPLGGMEMVRGIGAGVPNGNFYTGYIQEAMNLPWQTVPFAKLVSDRFGLPCRITNDANAAAMGEMTYGVARGMKNFIMITLGTGVGSGIVVDGKIVYGSDGFAGELGHFVVDHTPAGRKCGCGRSGCLETYCSATGVARTAREFLEKNTCDSLLRSLDPANITSYDVFKAAEQGDKIALEIFDFTGKMLGTACADFTTFNTPEAFVFFGGLTKAGDYLMKPLKEAYDANVLNIFQGNAKLLISSLNGSEAAVLGASALGWE